VAGLAPSDTELGKNDLFPELEVEAMYDKILVAIDHSAISERVLAAARDLALLSKGEVWVLHLLEREITTKTGVVLSDETAAEASAQVAAAVDKLTAAGVKAHGDVGHTIFGYAARSIVDDAIELDVDTIVMGLARPRRPGGPGPGQRGAQGDSPRRPPGPDRQVTAARLVACAATAGIVTAAAAPWRIPR